MNRSDRYQDRWDRSFRGEIKYSRRCAAGNYEVAKEKYRAPLLEGWEDRVGIGLRRENIGLGREMAWRGWKEGRKEKKSNENRLEEELPEITENVERMKGREERGGTSESVCWKRGWKGRLACVPWCKFVLASGRLHASNPLVSAS